MKCKKLVRAMIAFVVAGSMSITVNATSISDLKDQKDQKESKKAEAEAVLEQLQSEQKSILDAIEELDAQVTEYTNQITELEGRQTQLESDIEQKQTELAAAQEKEQQQYEAMKERIRYSYENGNPSYLDVLFSTSDISDIVNQTEYADQIYSYDKNMFDEFVETRQTIADTKAGLESDLKEVEDVKLEVEDNKAAVEVMIEGKQTQVANYQSSIGDYESTIAELEQDIAATDQAIAAAEEAYRQQQAAAAAAAAAAGSGSTTSAPTNVDVTYTGGSLQWPVSSGGTITSRFGPRESPGGIGSRYHQGLDIGCPTGTPIVACEAGTVIAASYSGSMGNYVTIAHSSSLTTTYMHNSSICVSVGQTVSRGQVIALAGSTGNSTGPHCHLGVRVNGSYVDPLPYLQ
ncbi:MAG: peptidoglycan DD-metalloendopeptidase family protein [Lachnospiraceae bacterium]|nr:peptidoglycan DD-metalloendopeptidase family protein [Lachnospiraceae bacterium]